MANAGVRELRSRKDGAPNVTNGDAFAKSRRALFKAKYLRYSEKNTRVARRLDHLAAFVRVHRHGLLAQHRLAGSHRGQDVLQVAGIGSSDQHGINFRAAAEFLSRGENMWDAVFCRGFMGLIRISARQRDHLAILGESEAWHQSPHRVQPETCNTETSHLNLRIVQWQQVLAEQTVWSAIA
jgi:hypothetical protein